MGLFDKIFRPQKNREMEKMLQNANTTFKLLSAYEPVFINWRGQLYEAAQCRAAIDAIARHGAKLKVTLQGKSQSRLKGLLEQRPNNFQSWYQFLYRAISILYAQNNCFIAPVKDNDMSVTGYISLLPSSCSLVEYKDEVWIRYEFANGMKAACKFNECALLTRFQYEDDIFGSDNTPLNETLSLISLNSQAIREAVKNSNSFRFMGILKNMSKDEDLVAESKRFTELNFSKDAKANGILLFPNLYTDVKQINSQPLTVDAKQMELINNNIYTYFGVNEKILTSTASGEELDAFFNGVIEGISIQLSECLTAAIFTEKELRAGNKILFTANRLQYMNVTQKVNMVQQLMDRGVMTINEARELFNYPTVEGGDIRLKRGEYKNADDSYEEDEEEP